MNRYTPGNRITLLRSGIEYFPALLAAIAAAEREVWLETYIYADDETGRRVADALVGAVARGVLVRVMVDGWGARHYLTRRVERYLVSGGVRLLKYRPEVRPWHFRSHRLRRLHRKLCHVDGKVAFVGGINIIDDMHTPGHKPPRVDFAVRIEGPILPQIVATMQRVWAINELVQNGHTPVPLFPPPRRGERVGAQTAKFVIRDNLRHRRDIEQSYLAAIRTAKREVLIANSYFFPGVAFRRALIAAAQRGVAVTLLLQARVEFRLLHYATRALYGQLLQAGIAIQEYHRSFLHAKVAVIDTRWATVGSSNIDPYSLLMAREANVFVRDPYFADQLREELVEMIAAGARVVGPQRWAARPRVLKALNWIAYGVVRVAMGILGYGGNEWFRGRRRARGDAPSTVVRADRDQTQ
ncbi:MAG TPA: cardiolipin synthase ClsB [Casimicrobiaceae bacterium]|nr:cardiolipin synthase ClsB [Casimicrobiaceae bacterium]